MLYIEDAATTVTNTNLMDDGSDQIEVGAERKSWLDTTLGELFRKSFVAFEIIFGFFVKLLVLGLFGYLVYSIIDILPEALAELGQMFTGG